MVGIRRSDHCPCFPVAKALILMVKIDIGNESFEVASKIEELTRKQFLAILPFLLASDFSIETRIKVASKFCPGPMLQAMEKLPSDQLVELARKLTSWMEGSHIVCPIPSFRIGLTWYHTPVYSRMSTIEAAKAQQYLELFRKENKEEYLNLFVATLCRPKRIWIRFAPFLKWVMPRWDGDIRIRYNAVLVAEEAKAMAKLPQEMKWAVIWHFCQMMAALRNQYKSVFDYRTEGSTSKPSSLMDMIFHLSGSELGDAKAVSHNPITTVMYVLKCRLPI